MTIFVSTSKQSDYYQLNIEKKGGDILANDIQFNSTGDLLESGVANLTGESDDVNPNIGNKMSLNERGEIPAVINDSIISSTTCWSSSKTNTKIREVDAHVDSVERSFDEQVDNIESSIDNLSRVARTGDYDDLIDKPILVTELNLTEYTFVLPRRTRSSYYKCLMFYQSGTNDFGLYMIFIKLDDTVFVTKLAGGSNSATFTGTISGTTLVLKSNAVIYGGLTLLS